MSGSLATGEPLFIVQKKIREGVQKGPRPDITGRDFEMSGKPAMGKPLFIVQKKFREGGAKGASPGHNREGL